MFVVYLSLQPYKITYEITFFWSLLCYVISCFLLFFFSFLVCSGANVAVSFKMVLSKHHAGYQHAFLWFQANGFSVPVGMICTASCRTMLTTCLPRFYCVITAVLWRRSFAEEISFSRFAIIHFPSALFQVCLPVLHSHFLGHCTSVHCTLIQFRGVNDIYI